MRLTHLYCVLFYYSIRFNPTLRGKRMADQNSPESQRYHDHLHLISVKGIVLIAQKIPLLMNEREEWELPGGKLERLEDPEACVVRELVEELGITADAEDLVDAWQYPVAPEGCVLILTYGCTTLGTEADLKLSSVHTRLDLFDADQIDGLHMPDGYKRSIYKWLTRIYS